MFSFYLLFSAVHINLISLEYSDLERYNRCKHIVRASVLMHTESITKRNCLTTVGESVIDTSLLTARFTFLS